MRRAARRGRRNEVREKMMREKGREEGPKRDERSAEDTNVTTKGARLGTVLGSGASPAQGNRAGGNRAGESPKGGEVVQLAPLSDADSDIDRAHCLRSCGRAGAGGAHRGGLEVVPGVGGRGCGLRDDGVDAQRRDRAQLRLRPHRPPDCPPRRNTRAQIRAARARRTLGRRWHACRVGPDAVEGG